MIIHQQFPPKPLLHISASSLKVRSPHTMAGTENWCNIIFSANLRDCPLFCLTKCRTNLIIIEKTSSIPEPISLEGFVYDL